jgi:WD40 repeat protein
MLGTWLREATARAWLAGVLVLVSGSVARAAAPLAVLASEVTEVGSMRFSRDGATLVIAGIDARRQGLLEVWSWREGKKLRSVAFDEVGTVSLIDLSPDARFAAGTTPEGHFVLELESGRRVYRPRVRDDKPRGRFAADGAVIYFPCYDWDKGLSLLTVAAADGAVKGRLDLGRMDHDPTCVAVSPDARLLAFVTQKGLELRSVPEGKTLHQDGKITTFTIAFAAPDVLLAVELDGAVSRFAIRRHKRAATIEKTDEIEGDLGGGVTEVALSADGHRAAMRGNGADLQGAVSFVDLRTGKVRTMPGRGAGISPAGDLIAVADQRSTRVRVHRSADLAGR